jgi:hypothetical protein
MFDLEICWGFSLPSRINQAGQTRILQAVHDPPVPPGSLVMKRIRCAMSDWILPHDELAAEL